MREILFRGKRTDNNEWVEGSFCPDAIEQIHGIESGIDGFIRRFNSDELRTYMFEVERETVCQFTGLTDKNGRKIFEGDIIKWHDNPLISVRNQTSEVCFGEYHDADSVFEDNKALGFYIRFKDGSCVSICALNEFLNDFEIIGNIYDNSKLLEVKQNG